MATATRRRRVGCTEPRIFTPPLRDLTPDTSAGYSVIEFAEVVLEIDLFPWQKWLLIHALELLTDGTFRFRTVLVFVARQNGKSTLSQVLGLWAIYIMGVALVMGTAQDLDTAETIWDEAVDLAKEVPDLAAEIAHVDRTNGKKALRLTRNEDFRHDRKWKVKAANRRAGRGQSGDLILLDELREHQTWDAWGAITHTTMARPNAQIWALSNAGDLSSIVARYLRTQAHVALGNPDGLNLDGIDLTQPPDDDEFDTGEDALAIFEWSAHPDCGKWDRDGWAQANPSMGYGITERTIAAAAHEPEWQFRTEVLCQWSDGTLDGPFPAGSWEAGIDLESAIAGRVTYAIDTAWDRSWTYVAVAGKRPDGLPHVEVVERGMGHDWVLKWFKDRAVPRHPVDVVVQKTGAPVSSIIDDLVALTVDDPNGGDPLPAVTVVEWAGPDLGAACGVMFDRVRCTIDPPADAEDPWNPAVDGLRHLPQAVLDVAAATAATKPTGDAWVWNRAKSPQDIAPLVACTGALWRAMQPQEVDTPSAYEDNDLMVV